MLSLLLGPTRGRRVTDELDLRDTFRDTFALGANPTSLGSFFGSGPASRLSTHPALSPGQGRGGPSAPRRGHAWGQVMGWRQMGCCLLPIPKGDRHRDPHEPPPPPCHAPFPAPWSDPHPWGGCPCVAGPASPSFQVSITRAASGHPGRPFLPSVSTMAVLDIGAAIGLFSL